MTRSLLPSFLPSFFFCASHVVQQKVRKYNSSCRERRRGKERRGGGVSLPSLSSRPGWLDSRAGKKGRREIIKKRRSTKMQIFRGEKRKLPVLFVRTTYVQYSHAYALFFSSFNRPGEGGGDMRRGPWLRVAHLIQRVYCILCTYILIIIQTKIVSIYFSYSYFG